MNGLCCVNLRQRSKLKNSAAEWFHEKWNVPVGAYLGCMDNYLNGETEYGWYLCLDGKEIVGGLGVIENDFHSRKDISPNICAVYTESEYRCRGIAGQLLRMAVDDLKAKDIIRSISLPTLSAFMNGTGGSSCARFAATENLSRRECIFTDNEWDLLTRTWVCGERFLEYFRTVSAFVHSKRFYRFLARVMLIEIPPWLRIPGCWKALCDTRDFFSTCAEILGVIR